MFLLNRFECSPYALLAVVLPHLERVCDVVYELGVVEQEVHCVLHALDPDRQGDVVVAAEERKPELAVFLK